MWSVLASIFAVSISQANATIKFVYADEGQTEANEEAQKRTWGPECSAGREQSPINIDTSMVAASGSLPNIQTTFTARLKYVKNTGHGFQLFETSPDTSKLDPDGNNVEVDATGTPKGYSTIGGERYAFYQVHWHHPSENTIDGRSFPLEAHFVHQLSDPSLVGTLHRLAVIGLMYEYGDCNPALDSFWSKFPQDKGANKYTGEPVDLDDKLEKGLKKGYYHWYGSLTTPPCTEGVSWNLLREPETVCQAQVSRIQAALNETQQGIGFNNRVAQPLNHRVVSMTGEGWSNAPAAKARIAIKGPLQNDSIVSIVTLVCTVVAFVAGAMALVRV